MKALDSSRDEPAIRYEIEQKKYTGVVCAKGPLMIKLEWNSVEVYHKRIQFVNSFWDGNCVPFSLWLVWVLLPLYSLSEWISALLGYRAVGINGWLLLFANGYSSIGAQMLLLSCLGHGMSFMASSIIDVHTLRLALNII